MINHRIEELIEKQKKYGEFVYPDYDRYCFSNIPSTILSFFGIKSDRPTLPKEVLKDKIDIDNLKKVVLFLVDGFGFNQWRLYNRDNSFFKKITERGIVFPITTIFPSTTAAALTTINSGLTPQEHGLPEWNVYFKEIDMILTTLPFRPLDDELSDEFKKLKPDPKMIFNKKTVYQKLKKKGVKSFAFLNKNYSDSEYSKLSCKGSEIIPFIKTSDLVVNLRKGLEEEDSTYFFVYYDGLDSIEHEYGPHTEQHTADIKLLSYSLTTLFLRKMKKQTAKETAFVITSDHGQVNIPPEKTLYLNNYKNLANSFQRSERDKPILPWGSPRDVFLSIKPEKLDEIKDFLSVKLKRKSRVMKTEDAFKNGLFGRGRVHKQFRNRVGNLLILPYRDSLVWYEHVKDKKVELIGHHGGLSKEEMLVPFSISRLSDLF